MNRFRNHLKDAEFEAQIKNSYITNSPTLLKELYKIKNFSFSDKPIFISGETGTGKTVVAELIDKIVGYNKMLDINCSQYTDELIASELFGHVRGAFTGANDDKVGVLERANNGIIFLDEIHALSPKAQKTLLKAIEEKEFYPVGSDKKVKSNFRVVSATCENIFQLIQSGQFREDLYARISTFSINLPPIRERAVDIMLLIEHFLSKQPFRILINDEAEKILKKYDWPRNTREIQDLVENWVAHGHRLITPEVLPVQIKTNINPNKEIVSDFYLDLIEDMGLREFLIVFKKELIQGMVRRHRGVVKHASAAMGTSYGNLTGFLRSNSHKSFGTRRSL